MKNIILKIIQNQTIFAKFLNTLSLLEYIGARKILKSQAQEKINLILLDHAEEELRHAQVLKRAALKLVPQFDTYSSETLLCGKQASQYFQTIDHTFNTLNPEHAYLYTTWIIEERALKFYSAFDEVLLENKMPTLFRGILIEEQNHLEVILAYLNNLPEAQSKMQQAKELEDHAFKTFLAAVEKACYY